MDYSEKWGRDTDEAVRLALDDLGLTIDQVEVTVLEEPSRGFFGIGSKLAKVRVEKKKPPKKEEAHKQTRPDLVIPIEEARARDAANREKQAAEGISAEEPRETRREKRPRNGNKRNNRKEHSDRTGSHAKKEVPEVREPIIPTEPEEDLKVMEDHPSISFLKDLIKEMGLEADVTGKMGEEAIYLNIQGKDSGTIIGKRGQTLDAVQYLTSLVVNKDQSKYTRVVVDAENYRAKRERTLEALSYRLANKVVKSRRPVRLEPMNPYERKVIHATLQSHPKVTTRSEGEDPYRRVVIELK
ncbi:MAG: protein jag [Firmicutes bacterium]|nr:protein jag [Bacillota bacterium]